MGVKVVTFKKAKDSIVAMAATEYQAEDEGDVDGDEETTPVQPIETGEQQ